MTTRSNIIAAAALRRQIILQINEGIEAANQELGYKAALPICSVSSEAPQAPESEG